MVLTIPDGVLACGRKHRPVIPHLDQAEIDQPADMWLANHIPPCRRCFHHPSQIDGVESEPGEDLRRFASVYHFLSLRTERIAATPDWVSLIAALLLTA